MTFHSDNVFFWICDVECGWFGARADYADRGDFGLLHPVTDENRELRQLRCPECNGSVSWLLFPTGVVLMDESI